MRLECGGGCPGLLRRGRCASWHKGLCERLRLPALLLSALHRSLIVQIVYDCHCSSSRCCCCLRLRLLSSPLFCLLLPLHLLPTLSL